MKINQFVCTQVYSFLISSYVHIYIRFWSARMYIKYSFLTSSYVNRNIRFWSVRMYICIYTQKYISSYVHINIRFWSFFCVHRSIRFWSIYMVLIIANIESCCYERSYILNQEFLVVMLKPSVSWLLSWLDWQLRHVYVIDDYGYNSLVVVKLHPIPVHDLLPDRYHE